MDQFDFYQVARNSGLEVTGRNSNDTDAAIILSITFHAMFAFIRSNDLKKSFSEIVLRTIDAKCRALNKTPKEIADAILAWTAQPRTNEARYLSLLYTKRPSKELVEFIWNLREVLIQISRKENYHFKSADGLFLLNSDLPKVLKSVGEVREIRPEEIEKRYEANLRPENARGVVDANEVILFLARLFARYNCYALKDTGPYIPVNRSVNAYVYLCFKNN